MNTHIMVKAPAQELTAEQVRQLMREVEEKEKAAKDAARPGDVYRVGLAALFGMSSIQSPSLVWHAHTRMTQPASSWRASQLG